MVLKKMAKEFQDSVSDWPSLICEWGDFSYSESLC